MTKTVAATILEDMLRGVRFRVPGVNQTIDREAHVWIRTSDHSRAMQTCTLSISVEFWSGLGSWRDLEGEELVLIDPFTNDKTRRVMKASFNTIGHANFLRAPYGEFELDLA